MPTAPGLPRCNQAQGPRRRIAHPLRTRSAQTPAGDQEVDREALPTIAITLTVAVWAAVAAQTALGSGEPKNQLPFTRPVAQNFRVQAAHVGPVAATSDPRSEPKNQLPFTRPVANGTRSQAGSARSAVIAASPKGEPKNQQPFTQPAASPTIVVGPEGSFDWGDAAIGAGATLGLLLIAAGAAALVTSRHRQLRPTGA